MPRDGEVDPECGDEEGPPSRTRSRLKRKQQEVVFPLSNTSKSKQRKEEFEELDGVNQVSPTLQPQSDKEKPNCKDQSANSDKSLAVKAKESPKHDDRATCTGQPSVSLSAPLILEKQTLELILDVLQRRDTYEIFAEPVDPKEVEDYYEIITEPMDFGTMRAKLHEGMYKTLEQFEHDIFLISQNAMHFNSSATIFFRQARAINELSKKVFYVLKNDPENFISEFSGTRRRSSRRPLCESKDLNFKSCPKVSKNEKPGSGPTLSSSSSPSIFRRNTRGGIRDYDLFRDQDGRISSSSEADRRCTYQPWDFFHTENDLFLPNISTNLEPLILMNQRDLSYSESLMMFVKDLGPTAQMIAKRKLNGLSLNTPSDSRIEAPLSLVSSAFSSTQIKPSTQDTPITSSSQKLIDLFPRSQTTQRPASDMIDLTDADDEEKAYYTSEKMGNLGNEGLCKRNEMNIFHVFSPHNQMGSCSSTLAYKAHIFGNSGTNSNAVTLALAADSRRKNNSSSSSWLAQASGLSSLSQTSGSTDSLNSRCQATAMLAPMAQANQYLEPNRLTSSVSGFTFDLPFLQSQLNQMNYIGNDSLSQPTLQLGFGTVGSIFDPRGYKNYTHQEEPSTHSFLNGQSCSASLNISDTDLVLQL